MDTPILNIMKLDRSVIICLAILICFQFFPGIDLTHHLEASRLYHEMITNRVIFLNNPYLLAGEQLTIVYGSIFYLLAGIVWFFFERFTLDILSTVSILLSFLLIVNLTERLGYRLIALLFLSAMSIPDAYVANFANLLLWLTAYMFIKGKKYYQVPLVISCLSHPFSIIVGLYYAYKDRKNIVIIVISTLYFIAIGAIFTFQGNIVLPNVLIAVIGRAFIGLYPILFYEKFSQRIMARSIMIIAIGVIPCNILQFVLIEPYQMRGFYEGYHSLFKGFPTIKGNMRVVDYNYLPSAYYFHQEGLTINTGSFFESWIYNTRKNWDSVEEYENYLKDNNISYVLICKKCGSIFPGVNQLEQDVLLERHKLIWENDYYKLYLREG